MKKFSASLRFQNLILFILQVVRHCPDLAARPAPPPAPPPTSPSSPRWTGGDPAAPAPRCPPTSRAGERAPRPRGPDRPGPARSRSAATAPTSPPAVSVPCTLYCVTVVYNTDPQAGAPARAVQTVTPGRATGRLASRGTGRRGGRRGRGRSSTSTPSTSWVSRQEGGEGPCHTPRLLPTALTPQTHFTALKF